jgi:hypothetical protein
MLSNGFRLAVGLYHWATCFFIIGLVLAQLLGAVWDSTNVTAHVVFGRDPALGPYQIVGTNDVPYTDQAIACVGKGRSYEPRLVSALLAAPGQTAILEDSTGTAVHGYRLKRRITGSVADALDSIALPVYARSCGLIASTVDNIFKACLALGYSNLTRDNLRVVDDWSSDNVYLLPDTLPILIMPFWDNAVVASFRGVNQSVRQERTVEWLSRPGGTWKNGWYEDSEGVRWYSDVVSTAPGEPYFMMRRVFDMRSGKEVDCSNPDDCEMANFIERWGDKLSYSSGVRRFSSVYVANGTESGLFVFQGYSFSLIRSVFDWETLLSNVYTWWILHRWVLAQSLILTRALRGNSFWCGVGISCVSASKSFAILPLVSLPRLKMTLAAFWTVGCSFQGQQGALTEAWFAIYPAIVHLVLIYFSILNTLGKALRLRVSDVLFAPTVVAFCLMHYFRAALATSGWLSGVDGRVPTLVFSDEVDTLQLADYFTTDIAWRMNGRVALLFYPKLCILALNLLPLLLARPLPTHPRGDDKNWRGIEKALALSAKEVGGLGSSPPYIVAVIDSNWRGLSSSAIRSSHVQHGCGNTRQVRAAHQREGRTAVTPIDSQESSLQAQHQVILVSSFELIRLGYLVFGDAYVTTFQEYGRICAMAPLRAFFHLWNHRVLVWTLRPEDGRGDAEIAGGRALESTEPQMWRLDDPRLRSIRWWQVSACSVQC